jgi:transposase-like protein
MGKQSPYPPEFRERAVRLVLDDGLTPNRSEQTSGAPARPFGGGSARPRSTAASARV